MKNTRQNSLQDRLSAMFRILPSAAASALVFSLVYFSPLIDLKDTNAAAAQTSGRGGGEGGGGSSESGGGGGGSSGESSGNSGGGGNSAGSGGNSGGGGRGDSGSENTGLLRERNINIKTPSSNANNSSPAASQSPTSTGLLNNVGGSRRFAGDSEPSGGALSRSQEREAIASGWK